MKLLALDSSDGCWSVALQSGNQLWMRGPAEVRDSLAAMNEAVSALLAEAGISIRGLDRIACTRGPGGFTGVRVAVGLAQGLALGAELPVSAVSSLAALASAARADHPGAGPVLCAMDARMGELYWAAVEVGADGQPRFRAAEALAAPAALSRCDATLGAGRGFAAYPELAAALGLSEVLPHCRPDAAAVARLAAAMPASELLAPERLEPLYLRHSVASPRRSG